MCHIRRMGGEHSVPRLATGTKLAIRGMCVPAPSMVRPFLFPFLFFFFLIFFCLIAMQPTEKRRKMGNGVSVSGGIVQSKKIIDHVYVRNGPEKIFKKNGGNRKGPEKELENRKIPTEKRKRAINCFT